MNFDADMKKVAADSGAPVILMHIKGTPKDMQKKPKYGCVITEIIDYLARSINEAAKAGVKKDNIIIDPGIGFGKTLQHNIKIIRNLSEFRSLKKAILVGLSQKSMIGAIIDKDAGERLYGSLAANVISVQNGANILRVHDVDETMQAVKTARALM
jgi:dihydropteroate synthase